MFNIAEYRHKEKRLSDYLPWAGFVSPGVVLNKDGSFMSVVRFRGPDLDSCSAHELINARARMNNALKRFGSRWCLHIEATRRSSQEYPQSTFPDPVTQAIDDERFAGFQAESAQFESDYCIAFTYLPPEERIGTGASLFIESGSKQTGFSYRNELDQFCRQVKQVVNILTGFMPLVRYLEDADLLTYLHGCVSIRRLRLAVPPVPFYLDEMLTDEALLGGFEPKLGDSYLKTISVHAYPNQTVPGLLDQLNQLPLAYRWVVRWLPMDKAEAERHIGSVRRQWFAKRKGLMGLIKEVVTKEASALEDSDSVNKAQDANEALQCLGGDLCSYGYLTLTVTVWDRDARRAQENAVRVQQVIDGLGIVSKIETVNAVEAWLGSLPGHAYADVRRPVIGSLNLCDLIPISAVWSGPHKCEHLNGPVLLQAKTQGSTPFRLSLHQGDVGHAMVCGPTGAGKSTLLCLLAAQWRKYPGAQVYFFDKGGSCKVLTHAVGGDYYDLGAQAERLSFQPLRLVDREPERIWAQQWLVDILQREGVETPPHLKQEIYRVLQLMGSDYDVSQRTLSSFTNLVQSIPVKEALRSYTLEGPYGYLLDSNQDNLEEGTWQAFEMEQLMKTKAAAVAVLTYLFHRLESRFSTPGNFPGTSAPGSSSENTHADSDTSVGKPTLLILDEAWVFLAEGFFATKINEWLKVLRKRNVAVVFATQSLADIQNSPIAPALIENCPTRIFLPNPRALDPTTRRIYEAFGLNDQQLNILATATPKREYYYQSRDGNRLFEVGLDPESSGGGGSEGTGGLALAFCGASAPSDQKLVDQIVRRKQNDESGGCFAYEFLHAKGLTKQAGQFASPNDPRQDSDTPKQT